MLYTMLLLSLFIEARAEIQSLDLMPSAVHAKTKMVRGPHQAYWDKSVEANGLLLITFAGTKGLPSDLKAFGQTGAALGYRVLALDYVNTVISTHCRPSPQKDCFDRFRKEVLTGEDLLPDPVAVKLEDSIEFRIRTVLQYLGRRYPSEFKGFLSKGGEPEWGKFVVAGHSQGSGHAAFLAKHHPLRGVAALAGPQDTFESGIQAPWLRQKGSTPPERHLFLLHHDDFFGSSKQMGAARALGGPSAPVEMIEDKPQERSVAQIYLSTKPCKDAHMDVIQPAFQAVWKEMLARLAKPGAVALWLKSLPLKTSG